MRNPMVHLVKLFRLGKKSSERKRRDRYFVQNQLLTDIFSIVGVLTWRLLLKLCRVLAWNLSDNIFFWIATSSLQLWPQKCMLVLLHKRYLSKTYWNGSNWKFFHSTKNYFTNKIIINTVLSENMLHKIEVSNRPTKNLNWLEHFKNLQVNKTIEMCFGKRCSEVCGHNSWKISMKKFILSKILEPAPLLKLNFLKGVF